MKKQLRKILTGLLAAGMALSLIPANSSYAFNKEDYEVVIDGEVEPSIYFDFREDTFKANHNNNVTTAYFFLYSNLPSPADVQPTLPDVFNLGTFFDEDGSWHSEFYDTSTSALNTFEEVGELEHGKVYKFVTWYPCGKLGVFKGNDGTSDAIFFSDKNKEYTPAYLNDETEVDIYEVTQDDVVFLVYCAGRLENYPDEITEFVKNYIETEQIVTKWELTGETKPEAKETQTVAPGPEASVSSASAETSSAVSASVQPAESTKTSVSDAKIQSLDKETSKSNLPLIGGIAALVVIAIIAVIAVSRKKK
ncbi:MAG: hypothetical protein K5796_08145 [Lachnospiraceae bacterium]|nr:hypothetical protein [Lachnospiraceae bacterium]